MKNQSRMTQVAFSWFLTRTSTSTGILQAGANGPMGFLEVLGCVFGKALDCVNTSS